MHSQMQLPYLVHVRFEEDEDAPCFPYPPCCVLSRAGLATEQDRLSSPAVLAVLARIKGRTPLGWEAPPLGMKFGARRRQPLP